MAKDKVQGKRFTVCASEYRKEHEPVTTEGTVEEAIKAFQAKHGLDGLNLKWEITEVGSGVAVAAPTPPVQPLPPVIPIPPVPAPAPAPVSPPTK